MNAELPDFGTSVKPNTEVALAELDDEVQRRASRLSNTCAQSIATLRLQVWEMHTLAIQTLNADVDHEEAEHVLRVHLLILLERIDESSASTEPPFYPQRVS